jgi:hypothetical protein
MTGTSVGLNGEPVKFLGAYTKNITLNLGLSTNPTTVNVILAEDPCNDVFFIEPTLGTFHVITAGPDFSFGGVITKFERDISDIGGRLIRVSMSDPREIMRSIPVILAPGSQQIAQTINDGTECSILDVFGAFDQAGGLINLSQWNEAGMYYTYLLAALNGENIPFGDQIVPVPQQIAKAFGERYRFHLDDISIRIFNEYRINTNLVPISNIIEDLSQKFAFDWFVESSRAADDIIDVYIRIVDRSVENIDISLQDFLDDHEDRVVSATSGVELRNDVACLALQGAPIEQLLRVTIEGQANEPIDLVPESGANNYIMTEEEMRVVIAGKQKWEMWLASNAGPAVVSSGVDSSGVPYSVIDFDSGFGRLGYSRYGGVLNDFDINPLLAVRDVGDLNNLIVEQPGIPKNVLRTPLYLAGAKYANAGKIYQKLKSHALKSYGKRWVHSPIGDEIIESAWTRDAVSSSPGQVTGDNDPNEYFRQSDGRTRAYIEFSTDPQGGAFSLGLADLTNLFGNQDIFRNVTRFGRTYSSLFPGQPGQYGDILNLELKNAFNPDTAVVTQLDKADYTYNNSVVTTPTVRTSLYVAATPDKDGVIKIDAPVMEPKMDPQELLRLIRKAYASGVVPGGAANRQQRRNAQQAELDEQIDADVDIADASDDITVTVVENGETVSRVYPGKVGSPNEPGQKKEDADGNNLPTEARVPHKFKKIFGNHLWSIGVRAHQPEYAYIPVRSRYNRYGPVFSKNLGPESQGQIQIIQDDGFAPWEFGGASLMISAMQLKVDNASSLQKEIFSASITVENFPKYNIGQSLGKNSNINSIDINFSDQGVTTSYNLQTFVRRFGEFSKEDWARLALYANTGALTLSPSQQANFMESSRFRVMKQMTADGGFSTRSTGGVADLG